MESETLKKESDFVVWPSSKNLNSLIQQATGFNHRPNCLTSRRCQVDDFARTGDAIGDLKFLAGANKGGIRLNENIDAGIHDFSVPGFGEVGIGEDLKITSLGT